MAVTSLAGAEELRRWGRPVVTTSEVAKRLHIAEPAASQLMSRLAALDAVVRIQRGRWLLRPDAPMLAVPYLALPHLAYATGFWALASYGMIDQIPRAVEVATGGRSRWLQVGDTQFELQHLDARLLDGWLVRDDITVATPEKALFDAVYLRTARGVLDVRLPEIELPRGFNVIRLHRWARRIGSARVKVATERSLDRIVELAREAVADEAQIGR
jgi:predicted transcriptional regulator of viral defense system